MPSLVVTANTVAQPIAAERLDRVHRPTSLVVDNDAGAQDTVIRLQDIFTPAVTHGESSPTADTTKDRFRQTVLQGDVLNLNEADLKGIKFLGSLNVIADFVDTDIHITVGYETE